MRWTWTTIGAVIAIAVAALVGAVVLGQAVAKNDEPSSRAKYQASVLVVRDRIDFALARIGNSQSPEELATRIDEASATAGVGAEELADVDPPTELTMQNDKLVRTLQAFSDELAGTADTLRDPSFEPALHGLNSISFKQWDVLNSVLGELRSRRHPRRAARAPLSRGRRDRRVRRHVPPNTTDGGSSHPRGVRWIFLSSVVLTLSMVLLMGKAVAGVSPVPDAPIPAKTGFLTDCLRFENQRRVNCYVRRLLAIVERAGDPSRELPRIDRKVHRAGGYLEGACHSLMHVVGTKLGAPPRRHARDHVPPRPAVKRSGMLRGVRHGDGHLPRHADHPRAAQRRSHVRATPDAIPRVHVHPRHRACAHARLSRPSRGCCPRLHAARPEIRTRLRARSISRLLDLARGRGRNDTAAERGHITSVRVRQHDLRSPMLVPVLLGAHARGSRVRPAGHHTLVRAPVGDAAWWMRRWSIAVHVPDAGGHRARPHVRSARGSSRCAQLHPRRRRPCGRGSAARAARAHPHMWRLPEGGDVGVLLVVRPDALGRHGRPVRESRAAAASIRRTRAIRASQARGECGRRSPRSPETDGRAALAEATAPAD